MILDILFPPRCASCHRRISSCPLQLCSDCEEGLTFLSSPQCPQCARPFASNLAGDHLCYSCRQEPPPFERVWSCGVYDGTILSLVHHLKYHQQVGVVKTMATLIFQNHSQEFSYEVYDWMLPVPLHPRKIRQRGFNQSQLLVKHLARSWKIPSSVDLLRRIRETRPQIEMTQREREKNVRGAFAVPSRKQPDIEGKTCLLVDDVLTTGATASEAARVLKKNGAARVDVLTFARAV